ncbi:adenosine deaminase [Eubacterium ruminantium]|uniref:adenosine deaminase n=1 Tax=Eubacterium ruminantium TaxID=42322 RepID=A0A1T4KDG5_9FIRM|nr:MULTISPECIES: adenosine deaminase family protein [Eubacterium]SCW30997.1 adenosine deaminase [Eubacterium ruminantium]SDM24572.1 adenosine deaminase [Eubacterium ruminantium]SJZ40498.1 adenosine deaminase [Eubacterium ruminantium]
MLDDHYLCELHLHLDGSLPIETIKYLAEQEPGSTLPDTDTNILKSRFSVPEDCKDLNEYLEKFDLPLSLLQTEEAISYAVKSIGHTEEALGVDYVEIRFAPQLHLKKGLTQRQVIEAAADSAVFFNADHSTKIRLILCCMRGDDNHEANMETVRLAAEFMNDSDLIHSSGHATDNESVENSNPLGQSASSYKKVFIPSAKGQSLPVIAGIDLAGAEALYPTENFADIFSLAKELNVPFTIHAGEAAGPESIWTAVRFGAKRIGHGIAAVQDEQLMRYLADNNIVLEICPTSNINTKIVQNYAELPIKKFLKMGITVTINSDNMTVSNTDIIREFGALSGSGLTYEEKLIILKNAENSWL